MTTSASKVHQGVQGAHHGCFSLRCMNWPVVTQRADVRGRLSSASSGTSKPWIPGWFVMLLRCGVRGLDPQGCPLVARLPRIQNSCLIQSLLAMVSPCKKGSYRTAQAHESQSAPNPNQDMFQLSLLRRDASLVHVARLVARHQARSCCRRCRF